MKKNYIKYINFLNFYKKKSKVNKVQVEIIGLSSSPSSGGYALLLKETFGKRRLPIIIGAFEAQAIALELEHIPAPRPMTHDLIKSVIDTLGATVTEVTITELRDNTYFADIKLEVSSLTYNIDARPSDAIALAVRTEAELYVSEDVMEQASFVPNESDNFYDTILKPTHESTTENEQDELEGLDLITLQDKLRIALEQENYEEAARIRDKINKKK